MQEELHGAGKKNSRLKKGTENRGEKGEAEQLSEAINDITTEMKSCDNFW